MIDLKTIKIGDKVKVVGMGAPGFAKLGDTLEISKVDKNAVYAKRQDGIEAEFFLTCGLSRLDLISDLPNAGGLTGTENKGV